MKHRLGIELTRVVDPISMDIVLQLRIPQHLTRTDGEFKWRVIQAITLALTEKETQCMSIDTPDGLIEMLGKLEKRV